jgi:hypothetical protein
MAKIGVTDSTDKDVTDAEYGSLLGRLQRLICSSHADSNVPATLPGGVLIFVGASSIVKRTLEQLQLS